MDKRYKYIEELERLNSLKQVTQMEAEAFKDEFEYHPIVHYLNSLFNKVKPETASAELLKSIVNDILNREAFSEVALHSGFIDLAIRENVVNPTLIELKPGFSLNVKKDGIEPDKLTYTHHKNQIQKYLTDNEYIILTNLNTAFLFSRDALIEFEPFLEISFTKLLRDFISYGNLWDTVRRLEDNIEKPDLEKDFFENLKKWYEQFQLIEFDQPNGLQKEELIVLLMNKIIFIKTLEDYGLIPYKFLQDNYFEKKRRWETKGYTRVFDVFFEEIEAWFWEFYDTELFKISVWNYIKKDKTNVDRFKTIFERTLGLANWDYTFGKGMIHYNYRLIDEDVFGKAYETFIAENKKDSGIYYTPKPITQYMTQKLVKLLFEDKINAINEQVKLGNCDKAIALLEEIRKIKIADTCAGSGSFLIKVLREVYKYYEILDERTAWVDTIKVKDIFDMPANVQCAKEFRKKAFFDDYRKLIASIVLNHICAIDIDERALETGKTNIWKEAVKLRPEAFGYQKLPPDINHILPNLELNFINADSIFDLPLEEEVSHIETNFKREISELYKIRNSYLNDPYNPDVVEANRMVKTKVRVELTKLLPELKKPTLIALEFFFLFFDEKGKPLPRNEWGFSAIISNPPWEIIMAIKKEFVNIRKQEMNILDFDKWFNSKMKSQEGFKKEWEEYEQFYQNYNRFLDERYSYQGIGQPNFYKHLIERDIEITKQGGYINVLVPSGIQTDAGSLELKKLIFENYNLLELSSFENRGYSIMVKGKEKIIKLFPDVDGRFKFSIFLVLKSKPPQNYAFDSRFYLLNPNELEKKPLRYSLETIKKFSPENLSIMEFESETDLELCTKIRNEHKLLGESPLRFKVEFNVSNDKDLFTLDREYSKLENKKDYLPLYEGKMIHQFNSKYSLPNYHIKDEIGKDILLDKTINRIRKYSGKEFGTDELKKKFLKSGFTLDCENYRLAYRAIGRSTDERTLISTILPKNIFVAHSLNPLAYSTHGWDEKTSVITEINVGQDYQIYLCSLFNSLTINYYMRNKVSANLTMPFMYEIPIPEISKKQQTLLIEKGFNLLYDKSDKKLYEDLKKELGVKVPAKFDSIKTRAELEVLIAKELFGLSKDDWKYLTSTFVYGESSDTKKELDKIIEQSIKIY